jgi:hypothetical protein
MRGGQYEQLWNVTSQYNRAKESRGQTLLSFLPRDLQAG